jgi:hypothetical protein
MPHTSAIQMKKPSGPTIDLFRKRLIYSDPFFRHLQLVIQFSIFILLLMSQVAYPASEQCFSRATGPPGPIGLAQRKGITGNDQEGSVLSIYETANHKMDHTDLRIWIRAAIRFWIPSFVELGF